MRLLLLLTILLLTHCATLGQPTCERTLRIDYQLSGRAGEAPSAAVSEMCSFNGWAGRRHHLAHSLLKGNADVTMTDLQTGEALYHQSFSTLFQEWLTTSEAQSLRRSFEQSVLLPMPKDSALVTLRLYNLRNPEQTELTFSHKVKATDILIRQLDSLRVPPHRYLLKSGSPAEKIDVAIVAEGYTAEQADAFYQDAQAAMDAILSHEPFSGLKDRFNFVAVAAPSHHSDVSIPLQGIWRETALGSHFSTFYSDRYLTTLRQRDLHNLLSGIPYEHIIILANTYTYGGGGIYNTYTLTTTHHTKFRPVVVHEFGHSFAGLGDEYYYDDQYELYYSPEAEPWEQNLTTLCHFEQKWQDLLPENCRIPTPANPSQPDRIGVYEGGGYMSKGVYRAYQDCRMKTNEAPSFCPVCQRAIARLIHFYTD